MHEPAVYKLGLDGEDRVEVLDVKIMENMLSEDLEESQTF